MVSPVSFTIQAIVNEWIGFARGRVVVIRSPFFNGNVLSLASDSEPCFLNRFLEPDVYTKGTFCTLGLIAYQVVYIENLVLRKSRPKGLSSPLGVIGLRR